MGIGKVSVREVGARVWQRTNMVRASYINTWKDDSKAHYYVQYTHKNFVEIKIPRMNLHGSPLPHSTIWNLSPLKNVCPLKTGSQSRSWAQASLPDHYWALVQYARACTLQWKAGETLSIWRMRSRTSFPQLEVIWERWRKERAWEKIGKEQG